MNYIKFSNKFLLAFLAVSIFSACTDLEVEEKDSIIVEGEDGKFTAGNPTELLIASYKNLGAFTDQANIYALYEQPSDEMIPPTRGVDWATTAYGVRCMHTLGIQPTLGLPILGTNANARLSATIFSKLPTQVPKRKQKLKFLRAF